MPRRGVFRIDCGQRKSSFSSGESEQIMGDAAAGIDVDLKDDVAILKPWGTLDLTGTTAIRTAIDTALTMQAGHFLIDLENVTFLDGAGLTELMRFREAIGLRGGKMSVINGRPQAQRLFWVTGSSRVLDVVPLTT